jgi:hypothetical protein
MARTTNNIYVSSGERGRTNLERGLAARTWGIREGSIDEKLHITGDVRTGRTVLSALQENDAVLFATGGPQPRVPSGEWNSATFKRAILCRVTRPYYVGRTPIWDDDVYEHRFDFEVVADYSDVAATALGATNAEALRVSANSRGLPVPVDVTLPLMSLVEAADAAEPIELGPGEPLDSLTIAIARREQRLLRMTLLGSAASGPCALCAKVVDRDQLRVAHIKRRSAATDAERRDIANVMLACLLGCDGLFERGYILVDDHGVITANPTRRGTNDVQSAIALIAGRRCAAFSAASATYFAWHRTNLAGSVPS